ncbi:PAS domain S-box protein [Aquimarina hainanensis]|uniref:histidine kinase n=1 Tax=Aquimarina hainanensis TaxID=1578017 RepID=A0ABW5N7T1_9FLAO
MERKLNSALSKPMDNSEIDILKRTLQREKAARKQAEKILESKSKELFYLTQELQETNEKLEDLVNEKKTELQGVFDNLVDAYVLMDIYGNVINFNATATELFGYDIKEEKLNVVQLIYKEDYQYAMKSFQQLINQGFFSDYQARVYTKHKGVRTVHINASIIYNKEKKPIAAQGIVRDITDEIAQKKAFEQQKKQLDIIVNNSSLGIVLAQFGKIIQTNASFQELLGYEKEELLNVAVKDITVEEDQQTGESLRHQLNAGLIDHFTINKRYQRKDGSSVWAKTNVTSVKNEQGSITHQVAIIENITEQLAFEKQREELVKDLEKSNQELNDYAHIVSHDLKSPLRSINALVNWLREDYEEVLDDTAMNHISMIETTLEKMENLINDILNYSSADNKNEMENEEVDLNKTIRDITSTIYIPTHITVSTLQPLPIIKADKTKIQQLFQNIIGNAINYNDKDKGTVEIDFEDHGSYYVFSIEDNGIGIEKEYHDKIFKVFQSLGKHEDSTGIGLSIVKKIVDLYEGDIWLESTPTIGTTFYFSIKKR